MKCSRCPRDAKPGRKMCAAHLKAESIIESAKQRARVIAGLCAVAGCGEARVGSRHCRKHADEALRRSHEYVKRRKATDPEYLARTKANSKRRDSDRKGEIRRRIEKLREDGFMPRATMHEILVRVLDDALMARRNEATKLPGRPASTHVRITTPEALMADYGLDARERA